MKVHATPFVRDRLEALLHLLTSDDFHCGFAVSPYETLAVASAPFDQTALGPEWPRRRAEFLSAFEREQASDGSWGSDRYGDFAPDRIITTLAALAAYDRHRGLDAERRNRAVRSLREQIPAALTISAAKKPIAFEALLVELLTQAHRRGYAIIEAAHLEALVRLRDDRLHRKRDLLTRGRGTIHSILDTIPPEGLDWQRVSDFQESDGSMGIYPSSTAALLANLPKDSPAFERGAAYLRGAMRPDGSFPPFHPSGEFERWWSLLALAQSPLRSRIRLPTWLSCELPKQGISVAPSFSLPDVDTTSMKAATLLTLGHPVDLDFLHAFYRGGVFECYQYEDRVSPSANVHALMAIVAAAKLRPEIITPEYTTMMATALRYLLDALGDSDHFQDKWHLSDIYTTAHAAELFADMLSSPALPGAPVLVGHVRAKLERMARYLLENANADGGFGCRRTSTVEETGYVVRALCVLAEHGLVEVPERLLVRAGIYLQIHEANDDPPLWLGKTLYRSPVITTSQQLSAQSWLSQRRFDERRAVS